MSVRMAPSLMRLKTISILRFSSFTEEKRREFSRGGRGQVFTFDLLVRRQ